MITNTNSFLTKHTATKRLYKYANLKDGYIFTGFLYKVLTWNGLKWITKGTDLDLETATDLFNSR